MHAEQCQVVCAAEIGHRIRALVRRHLPELTGAIDAVSTQIQCVPRAGASAEIDDRVVAVTNLEDKEIAVLAADERVVAAPAR
ncbi:hypothetical protein D9M70_561100 [compost metagenome]